MTTQTMPLPTVNLISGEFKANPFPYYARLRTSAPIYRTTMANIGHVTLVTRYEDVLALLKDNRFSKEVRKARNLEQLDRLHAMPGMFRALEQNMLDMDDPAHARLRNLVHKAFTPRMMEQMRRQIEEIVNTLIDKAQAKGKMDLVKEFALPVPLTIISKILGVPEKDSPKFHRWTKDVLELGSSPSALNILRLMPSLYFFMRYMRNQFRLRKNDPRDDLITALVQAEEAGDKLSEDEMVGMVFLLLVAGHETTVNLIASGTLALLEHPDQLELLRRNPDLIRTATEELLRYTAPVEQATERYALEEIEWHGVTIPKGELTYAVLASANRDETMFKNADGLDITRDPNRHLAFGQGIHFCLGAPLARMEGQIAIQTLIQRLPHLSLAARPDQLRWRSTMTVRGLQALPVTF
jgi:cytochrome P450